MNKIIVRIIVHRNTTSIKAAMYLMVYLILLCMLAGLVVAWLFG